uniref:SCP domain-containing protein n=1 Tax=Macrostomum lignano TaxID=282301 RepID=A0A1I8GB76_9PLAT
MAAALAEAAAAGGNFRHSDRQVRLFHRGIHAGEAIAYRVATCWAGGPQPLSGSEATQMWYAECSDPGYNFELPQPQDGTGHFTQLVWRASRLLGIAGATVVTSARQSLSQADSDSQPEAEDTDSDYPMTVTNVVVALYFPPGNVDKCFEDNVLPIVADGGSGGLDDGGSDQLQATESS